MAWKTKNPTNSMEKVIQLSNFDAVIFDMDGVLIDSEPLWKIAMEEVFTSLGSKLTKKDFEKTVGLRIDEVIRFWNKQENWNIDNIKEVEDRIIDRMVELVRLHPKPLPGVKETLIFLSNQKVKIGLATSSSSKLIEAVLESLALAKYFDFVHSAEFEDFGKPHPAVYIHVANSLDVMPHKCLVIEDSFNGVIAGLSAKMKVVAIPEKTHIPNPKLAFADFIFDDLLQFKMYLDVDTICK
ncbi:MAG: hexitol phosphatase HxpB [Bacteroidetes bacterium]|nr:hexitol phosphatase HxpB [Bacteroidota bacterium]